MISGATRKWSQRQTWALALLIVLSMGYSISTAFGANNTRNDKSENISLSTLMEARKSVEQSTTRFREEKIIQALNEEVILEGELVYRSPDYLAKKYSVPEKISYEITDNTVTVTDTSGRRQLNLSDSPVLHSLISALRGFLSGDINNIESLFKVEFSSTGHNWKMVLTPRDDTLKQFVSMMVFSGANNDINQLEFHEALGDLTTTYLKN